MTFSITQAEVDARHVTLLHRDLRRHKSYALAMEQVPAPATMQ
jgi:hypothetical protein